MHRNIISYQQYLNSDYPEDPYLNKTSKNKTG